MKADARRRYKELTEVLRLWKENSNDIVEYKPGILGVVSEHTVAMCIEDLVIALIEQEKDNE